MPSYLDEGEYKEALEHIVRLLGPGMCESHKDICPGCEYEWGDALETAKAVLGLSVPRHVCKHCGILDQIWSERVDKDVPGPMTPYYCHACGGIDSEPYEWIELPVHIKKKPDGT